MPTNAPEQRKIENFAFLAHLQGRPSLSQRFLEMPQRKQHIEAANPDYGQRDISYNFSVLEWVMDDEPARLLALVEFWRRVGFGGRQLFSSRYEMPNLLAFLEAHRKWPGDEGERLRQALRHWLALLALQAVAKPNGPPPARRIFQLDPYRAGNPLKAGIGLAMAGDRANLESAAIQPLAILLSMLWLDGSERRFDNYNLNPPYPKPEEYRSRQDVPKSGLVYYSSILGHLGGGMQQYRDSCELLPADWVSVLRSVVDGDSDAIVEVCRSWIDPGWGCLDSRREHRIQRTADHVRSAMLRSTSSNKPGIYGAEISRAGEYDVVAPVRYRGTGAGHADPVGWTDDRFSARADGVEHSMAWSATPRVELRTTVDGVSFHGELSSRIAAVSLSVPDGPGDVEPAAPEPDQPVPAEPQPSPGVSPADEPTPAEPAVEEPSALDRLKSWFRALFG